MPYKMWGEIVVTLFYVILAQRSLDNPDDENRGGNQISTHKSIPWEMVGERK
jgi:hypothetical protein